MKDLKNLFCVQKTRPFFVQKGRKQQTFLNKHRFMQMTLISQMQNHFSHLMMTTLLKLQQSWLIPHQKKIQTQTVMMSQTQKSKPFIHSSPLQLFYLAPLPQPKYISSYKLTLDPSQSQPFLILELQQQFSILRFCQQNSSYPIT